MSPLSILKYIVEHLEGSAYEPWVNAFLFLLFAVAVFSAIRLLIGKGGRKLVSDTIVATSKAFKNRKGYAPHWENTRTKVVPYIDLVSSLYFAFVGLYAAVLFGLTVLVGYRKAPWWVSLIGLVFVMASFYYVRLNLEAASWAHHSIKTSRTANKPLQSTREDARA